MKIKLLTLTLLFSSLFGAFAQDRTTVNAYSTDISDNLDLRAVASIFGDSEDLADFERRLNDPKIQISNLDLNGDNQVDYLRVIESVEGNTHLIIIQSVIGRDLFQDVATVEVERNSRNQVQVQVVGDVYMYGQNYIYEPVYVHSPVIYNSFWVNHYRPYSSMYYWNYYPSYYYAWSPYPIYTYQNNVHVHINNNHYYNNVNVRRSTRAVALHSTRRANAYESQNPTRSFTNRTNLTNRNDLVQSRPATRSTQTATTRTVPTTRSTVPAATQTRTTTVNSATARTPAVRQQSATRPTSVRTVAPATRSTNTNATRSTTSSTTRIAPTRQAPVNAAPRSQSVRSASTSPRVAPSASRSQNVAPARSSAPAQRSTGTTTQSSGNSRR